MTHVTINTEIETAVRDWAATTVKTDIARIKRTDILRSAGWTSAHCISPKSDGSAASDADLGIPGCLAGVRGKLSMAVRNGA